jgi:hypothetical protein
MNDDIADGDQSYNIVIDPATSADPAYDGLDPQDVNVINTDDETPGFIVSDISGDTTEAGVTATFTVKLKSEPFADVTVTDSSANTEEGIVTSGATLLFDSTNWNIEQIVTVQGVDDAIVDGDQTYSIILAPVVSSDLGYNGIDPADVTVINRDNDRVEENDDGNSIEDATDVDTDTPITGEIGTSGDVDYFGFVAVGGSTYTFKVTLGTLEGSKLIIYDAAGNVLYDSSNPSGAPSLVLNQAGTVTSIDWTCPTSDTFYVKVSGANSSDTGTYSLEIANNGGDTGDNVSSGGGGSGGCFIATASYEDNNEPSAVDRLIEAIRGLFR